MLTVNGTDVQKLQVRGPVGYTVVGSPTITDGVASGFSGNTNYLTIPAIDNSQWELDTVFLFKKSAGYQGLFSCTSPHFQIYVPTGNSGQLRVETGGYEGNDFTIYTALVDNTLYRLTFSYNNGTYAYTLYDENGTVIVSNSVEKQVSTWSSPMRFGITYSGNYAWAGYIDLNKTSVKKNGALWYWQPQPTKYIIKDGKLVWADPKIWLQSDGNSYIDTGIVANNETGVRAMCSVPNFSVSRDSILFGSRASGNSRFWFDFDCTGGNQCKILYGFNTYYGFVLDNSMEGNFYEVLFNWKNSRSCQFDGGYQYSLDSSGSLATQNSPIGIFMALVDNALLSNYCYTGKLRKLEISQGSTVIAQFVPVPAGLQIGSYTVPSNGMFDIITQTFYGNAGTGSFTIGRDE